ncbi:MAG TPA: ATP-binding protein [Anaeromyxobacteraceae bacterium]|nr:ATP-binding protein [Anaeromyxobacteraceae bacterium]
MSAASEQTARDALARDYAEALREYVSGAGEAALARAYELGRTAASSGVGLLEFAVIHHDALVDLPRRGTTPALGMATQFFAESLSPYEMTLRSYQANARLLGLSETLAQQNAEIDRAREQLRTILDATTAVIYLKDAEGRFLFVNRRFQEVFAVDRDQVLGRMDDEVLPSQVALALRSDDDRVLRAGVPHEVEEIVPAADGPRTYISLKFPLVDGSGLAYGLCCVATDITERKRAQEAQQRAQEAAERERVLREALEARDQFLQIASHELRTPLTSLELHLASFRRLAKTHPEAPVSDEKVQAKWDVISKQVDRLEALVMNLLDVVRITSGRIELARERIDLGELVSGVVARMKDSTDRARAHIAVHVAEPVVGSWDRSYLETVVVQLLTNAVKFGEEKPIAVGVAAKRDIAVLTVSDRGIGISEVDRERIFGRFERAVSVNHFGGFGTGLWIARQAVEAHGGSIRVAGLEGGGSVFTVELPFGAEGHAAVRDDR